ncbi:MULTISPECIES: M1 family metallopeptidase [Dyella]|uniref:M1 family peptidase n=2 Tax=Dyella TaxID=231454 RepID=A0A4R0YVA3_9GAMM|nr:MULTISPECIES: M1 family metallopeptidase [Dyella]TBR40027.1 M1 family peptidase [Dyella terrae]TCI12391.1 M1 family peptidase [Dyella soli]
MGKQWGRYGCLGLVLALAASVAATAQDAATPATPASSKAPVTTTKPVVNATPPSADAAAAPVVEQDIPLAGYGAAGVKEPSSPQAWGGERTGQEATLSDRVVSYRIDAELDAARHAVTGKQQMTWRNRSDRPVRSVYLHMYLNAFKNQGSTFFTERNVLTAHGHSRGAAVLEKGQWGHIDLQRVQQGENSLKWAFVQPDGGPKSDQTVVRVDLAQPVGAGETLTLDIDFLSQLPRVVERTGWWGDFNLVAQWFPKIAVLELPGERGAKQVQWNAHEFHFNSEFYADFGSYDVRMTVPSDYTVGAVGEQQGEPVQNGGKTTYHFMQGDVHDFAWVAAKGFRTMDTTYSGPGVPKVAVRVIYPPEYEASAQPVMKATTDSLEYFSRTLGAYPYKTVTAVVPPYNASEAGGMEYPTFFTAEGYKKIDPRTADQYMIDFVTIHEFGHGYFYGLLASNEFEEPMLDEGLNEYWDQRMLRERKQPLLVPSSFLADLGIRPQMDVFVQERLGAGLKSPYDPLSQNAWIRFSSSSYGTVYSRTATAMHDLEERLGTPVLERAFKEYYKRWHFRHPSAADLRQTLIDVSGNARAVNEIFDQYVYGTAMIDDRIASIDNDEVLPLAGVFDENGTRTEVVSDDLDKKLDKQRKAWEKAHPDAKKGEGPFPWRGTVTVVRDGAQVPQLLRVTFADGSHEDVKWDDERKWARFVFEKPSKIVSAELDPDRKILLDANKLNDSRTVEAHPAAARRWTSDVTALLQAFYSFLVTL